MIPTKMHFEFDCVTCKSENHQENIILFQNLQVYASIKIIEHIKLPKVSLGFAFGGNNQMNFD
jgi:hypothetical protein